MTQELHDLIVKKKIYIYILQCGRTLIAEAVKIPLEDECDPDRRQASLVSVMEIVYDIDEDGQNDFTFVPLAPGNMSQVTVLFRDQIASITHTSDSLKKQYWKMVTANLVVDAVMRGDVSKKELKRIREDKQRPQRTIASGDDYSITRVDDFDDEDAPQLPPNPAALRPPLDLESTAPFEVGLETFEGEEKIWKDIMNNFPHRPWKLNQ